MLLIYINIDVDSSSPSAVKSTQTKEDELWEEHDTNGRGEKRINKFSQNAWGEETIEDFGVDGNITLSLSSANRSRSHIDQVRIQWLQAVLNTLGFSGCRLFWTN